MDRESLKNKNFHDKIFGKLIDDKGYISKTLFDELFIDGIHLITKLRKNMKNSLMFIQDKIGCELLKRIINSKKNSVLPLSNTAALNFLLANGYEKYNELPRMVMGEKCRWYPEKIFNRGTGYAG